MFVLWWNLRIHEVSRSPSFTGRQLEMGSSAGPCAGWACGAGLVLGLKDSLSSQFWKQKCSRLQNSHFGRLSELTYTFVLVWI